MISKFEKIYKLILEETKQVEVSGFNANEIACEMLGQYKDRFYKTLKKYSNSSDKEVKQHISTIIKCVKSKKDSSMIIDKLQDALSALLTTNEGKQCINEFIKIVDKICQEA